MYYGAPLLASWANLRGETPASFASQLSWLLWEWVMVLWCGGGGGKATSLSGAGMAQKGGRFVKPNLFRERYPTQPYRKSRQAISPKIVIDQSG